ncbi:MAG: hypothetical protein ACRC67_15880 [Inquilinus sp.]
MTPDLVPAAVANATARPLRAAVVHRLSLIRFHPVVLWSAALAPAAR